MTWVVGATSVYGYGVLCSDVQVTLRNGTTRDLVRKAYPITNFIAAGFAGSVRIGFSLLQTLADATAMPEQALSTMAWDPPWVAERWAPVARSVFKAAPTDEQDLGSRILLLGASPASNAGLGSKMFLIRLASPDFRPGLMARYIMSCAIGTGAGIAEYKHRLKPHIRFLSGIHRAEVMNPNGWAQQLCFSLTRSLRQHPRHGISPHLHAVVVRRGQLSMWNNNENVYHPDGTVDQVRMPPVAESYEEFLQRAASAGSDGACARC